MALISYWILDGVEKTYLFREEIKNLGGKWNPDHKAWEIVLHGKDSDAHCLLKGCGLTLQRK